MYTHVSHFTSLTEYLSTFLLYCTCTSSPWQRARVIYRVPIAVREQEQPADLCLHNAARGEAYVRDDLAVYLVIIHDAQA